jgi:hypothetical protein
MTYSVLLVALASVSYFPLKWSKIWQLCPNPSFFYPTRNLLWLG